MADQLLEDLAGVEDLLIVQDLDGVCMQLVKDPLTRRMDPRYVDAAARLQGSFMVLTNGEHERRRGVNRLVETALGSKDRPANDGLYLPGLAAGGVQLQDRFGRLSHPGVSDAEMDFLAVAPRRMEELLLERLPALLPEVGRTRLAQLAKQAVLDTQVSPTVNLNGLFALIPDDLERQRQLGLLDDLMEQLLLRRTSRFTRFIFLARGPESRLGRPGASGSNPRWPVMSAPRTSSSCSQAPSRKPGCLF